MILFLLDWKLALATLAVVPLMMVATAAFRIFSSRAYRAVRERLGQVTATLAEDIAGMRVVQAYTREQANERHFREVNAHYRAANQQTVVTNGLYFPFVDFLSTAATAVVLGYGGYRYFDGSITEGTLLAFLLYLSNFFDPVQQLSQLYNTFLAAVAALDKIMDVMDEEPEVLDRAGRVGAAADQGTGRASSTFGSATATGPEVLHGLDLDVPAGTTVALVGHTGAGKSTIAKLLARFYEPRSGRITIDGHDLRDVTQESLRRQLGIVPQEGFLFAGTVHENIAFGRADASREDVEAAAARPWARTRSSSSSSTATTPSSASAARGCRSGQRQLIAFARALLADPRILILDEATSSVDIGTERQIERALRHLLTGANGVHHRAPALDDPRRRPDRRARARPGRRAGHPRRADGATRASTPRSTATGRPRSPDAGAGCCCRLAPACSPARSSAKPGASTRRIGGTCSPSRSSSTSSSGSSRCSSWPPWGGSARCSAAVVGIVGLFWLQGALVEAVADVRDGRADMTMGETFRHAQEHIGPLAVAGILAGLAIAHRIDAVHRARPVPDDDLERADPGDRARAARRSWRRSAAAASWSAATAGTSSASSC